MRGVGGGVGGPPLRDHLWQGPPLPVTLGFAPMLGTPEDFANHIKAESAEWGRVVREAHIKID
jgi:hypothetical protein